MFQQSKWIKKGWRALKRLADPAQITLNYDRYSGYKELIRQVNCGIGIEIGVREAYFSNHLIRNTQLDFLHGIDILNCPNAIALQQTVPSCYKFNLGNSLSLHENFIDKWFDIIHLDSNHRYHHVKKELEVWWPKLRPLGIISGDDYCIFHSNEEGSFGVVEAVNNFVRDNNLSLHIIGLPKLSLDEYTVAAEFNGKELYKYAARKPSSFKETLNWYIQKPE